MIVNAASQEHLLAYTLRLGDNVVVLGQRLAALVAAGPELEEELANANFALDYLGQARLFYSYAGELEGQGRGEDDFAFLRDQSEFQNLLLVEQPNGHFGDTIVRQLLFDSFYLLQLDSLANGGDQRLSEIAVRAANEIRYHLRHVSQWLIRLGDGTEESHQRVQESLNEMWRFCGEFFDGDEVDNTLAVTYGGPDLVQLEIQWRKDIAALLQEATLVAVDDRWTGRGGRQGQHSESFGFLLAEMQYMHRCHAGASW